MIAALILAGIAEFQSQRADNQRRKSEINQIKSLSLTAKTLLNSGNQVESLNSTLEANKKLIGLRNNLDKATKINLFSSLLENVSSIREFNSLIGHDASVNSVSFSGDGRVLASGSQDNTIKIWRRVRSPQPPLGREANSLKPLLGREARSPQPPLGRGANFLKPPLLRGARGDLNVGKYENTQLIQTLKGHEDGVFSVIFSPDNQYLIAGSFDNTVSLWRYNSTTGLFTNRLATISEPDGLWAIAFNPNNNIIATANENGKVKFWTVDGKLIKTISAHNQKIWSLNFSPDGKYFATASADNTIKIWDSEGRFLKTLSGHNDQVLSVNFSPDSNQIVSGSEDRSVKLWDLTGKLLHTFAGHKDEVLDVGFSPDGKLIASGSADDTVILWDVASRKQYQQTRYGSKAVEVKFNPDGKTLAIASGDKTVKLSYLKGILPTFAGNSVSISPNGEIAIANGNIVSLLRRDGVKNRRDAEGAEERVTEELSVVLQGKRGNREKESEIIKEKTSSASKMLASATKKQDASTFNESEIIKIIFSPTGRYFATIDSENQIKVWNLQGKLLQKWRGT